MRIERLKQRAKDLGLSYKKLSELSKVPLSTIQKIMSGATASPRYETILALEEAVFSVSPLPEKSYDTAGTIISEAAASYGTSQSDPIEKKPGEYTLEDYLALPEERRVELIDGVFYDMAAPTGYHQFLVGEIYHTLLSQAKSRQTDCRPFVSPLDVQLDCDDKTIVQPDVFGTCDSSRFKDGRYYGAPDLIIEVLSPSTRKKDIVIKGAKYAEAGVKEYWIIDLKEKRIMVSVFDEDIIHRIYGISDTIPVHISEGRFQVDFGEIYHDLVNYFPELKD